MSTPDVTLALSPAVARALLQVATAGEREGPDMIDHLYARSLRVQPTEATVLKSVFAAYFAPSLDLVIVIEEYWEGGVDGPTTYARNHTTDNAPNLRSAWETALRYEFQWAREVVARQDEGIKREALAEAEREEQPA